MAPAQHTLIQRAIDEIWNAAHVDIADELFAPTYVNHGGLITDLVHGPEAIKTSVVFYRLAFPKLHITIDALAATGQETVVYWHARNASPGERTRTTLAGRAPGCTDGFCGMTRTHESGGQIQESWTEWDREATLRQLDLSAEG